MSNVDTGKSGRPQKKIGGGVTFWVSLH